MQINTLRIQYQKINQVCLVAGLIVAALVAIITYGRMDSIISAIAVGISVAAATQLTRVAIMRFGVAKSLTPPGPFIERLEARSDNDILLQEFVRMGGKAASAAAEKLDDNAGDKEFTLNAKSPEILKATEEFFKEQGVLLTDESSANADTVKGIIGCGMKQMNPTVVTVKLAEGADKTTVTVHGVAKEGLVKQTAGEEAADSVTKYLTERFKS